MTASALPFPEQKSPRIPPGPRGKPVFGSLFDAWEDPLTLMSRSVREHGDVVRFKFAWIDYFLFNSPAGAHRVLVENAKGYHKSPNYIGLKHMLGDGLLTSEGEYWKKQRKLAQPTFHREKIAGFVRTMARTTSDWIDRASAGGVPRPIDMHAEMMRLTLRIIGLTLLSADLDEDSERFGKALNDAIYWANEYAQKVVRLPPWVPTPSNVRFVRARRFIEGVVLKVVEERRRTGEDKGDFLSMLMAAHEEGSDERMSDRQLLDELLTLTLAGHETTANALTFAFYLLSRHPEIAARLREEIAAAIGDREPTMEDFSKMPLCRAVIEETMRLYPPAWMVERIALQDDEVVGYRVPRGSLVGVCAWTLHRNPALWPDPERFDPERFVKPDPNRHKLAYLPFGGGPRTCIGNGFAMAEMQIILPMIVRRLSLSLAGGARVEIEPSITLRPRHGMPMVARPV